MGTGFCVPNRAHPNPLNTLSVDAAACPRFTLQIRNGDWLLRP